MTSITFVTCEPFGPVRPNGLTDDDALTAAALQLAGHPVQAVRWDDAAADWGAFGLVVVRSPWDYFRRLPEFQAWLDRLERIGARVHNPVAVMRTNLDKRYLIALAEHGVAVTPTVLVARGTAPSLRALLVEHDWDQAVVKPAVSGGAFDTWQASRTTASDSQARFAGSVAGRDMLIQPFLAEIAQGGEWSLVFFHGVFSHALRKFPADGDFRVQQSHGGTVAPAVAPREMIETATAIIAQVPGPLLYARVDGVLTADGFLLMELELIEPELFVRTDPAAPARFAHAILRTLEASTCPRGLEHT
ncbi:MAG: hypothetical protein ABIU54_09860 [Candidatus Eisenbacteria bacterium]